MSNWKSVLLRTAVFGASVAVVLIAALAGYNWYQARPKPWDSSRVKATFSHMYGTKGETRFFYDLQNTSDVDFELKGKQQYRLVLLSNVGALVGNVDESFNMELPIFIPAHATSIVTLICKEGIKADIENEDARQKAVEEYVKSEFKMFSGFAVFIDSGRIEIKLPAGWRDKK